MLSASFIWLVLSDFFYLTWLKISGSLAPFVACNFAATTGLKVALKAR